MDYRVTEHDRKILRELAAKQLELSQKEENLKRKEEWYQHNDLKGERPMVQLEMWGFTHETITPRQQCEGEFARSMEFALYTNFLNQELFEDDRVTPDFYGITYDTWFELFGLEEKKEFSHADTAGNGAGQHIIPMINDLEEDYGLLGKTKYGVNLESTKQKKQAVEEVIGDILPVKMKMDGLYSVPMQMMVNLMGMENMMYALADYPELFRKVLDRIAEDTLEYYRMLEEKHLILPTTSFSCVCQGCRTDFADIQNKKECGGNRQWQNHYLRNWAANTKGKGII